MSWKQWKETRVPDESRWNEIADCIADGRAVAYVGAGVSTAAGLPTWKDLLEQQAQTAITFRGLNDPDVRQIGRLLNQGDLEVAASLLKAVNGQRFERTIDNTLSSRNVLPTSVHLAIARMPFAQVVTTNFDPLMERAYEPPLVDTFLWNEPDAILGRLQRGEFCLIKLHGHFSNPAKIVITKEDFRHIQERHSALNQCLRLLFLTRHLLFVGHSLRDPDLQTWLSDLKLQFPDFGPHYALLPKSDYSPQYQNYLEITYGVRPVFYDCRPDDLGSTEDATQQHTLALTRHLTWLHGLVAQRRAPQRLIPPGHLLSYRHQLASLFHHTCSVLGVFRGDLCFLADEWYAGKSFDSMDRRDPQLRLDYVFGPTDRGYTQENNIGAGVRFNKKGDKAWPYSVNWVAFHRTRGGLLLPDVNNLGSGIAQESSASSADNELKGLHYRAGDTRVRSELAIPILAGDVRIGVVNVESNVGDGFTDAHFNVLHRLAEDIGQLHTDSQRSEIYRDVTLKPRTPRATMGQQSDAQRLAELMFRVADLDESQVGWHLFTADYDSATLRGETTSCETQVRYKFDAASFAAMIFRRGRPLYVSNRFDAPSWVCINRRSANALSIGNQLLGVPIFIRDRRGAVLCCWQKVTKPRHPHGSGINEVDHETSLRNAAESQRYFTPARAEMAVRSAQLLSRVTYLRQVADFQGEYDATITSLSVDYRQVIKEVQGLGVNLRTPHELTYDEKLAKALNPLLATVRSIVGADRVRIFLRQEEDLSSESTVRLVCVASIRGESLNRPKHRNDPIAPLWEPISQHVGKANTRSNPFVDYVVRRKSWSASAMLLYPSLLHAEWAPRNVTGDEKDVYSKASDEMAQEFGRDPSVGWYVAPITICEEFDASKDEAIWSTERRTLLGLIVVDNTRCYKDKGPEMSWLNDLPASRTWHELARLKLTWLACALANDLTR